MAHAVNHAQAALLPLVYLAIIPRLPRHAARDIAFLAAAGNFLSGAVQFTLQRADAPFVARASCSAGATSCSAAFMALRRWHRPSSPFAAANVVSRIGGSPQHPVGNGLLAEQFPPHRRGFAISAHIAGGNVGTVAVPLLGAWLIAGVGWRWTVVLFGIPPILIGLAMLC